MRREGFGVRRSDPRRTAHLTDYEIESPERGEEYFRVGLGLALWPRRPALHTPEVTIAPEVPACGHSHCRQNFIDTGESECVPNEGPQWGDDRTPEVADG